MNNAFGLSLVKIIVWIFVLGVVSMMLFPDNGGVMQANMTAVGNRGRDIVFAIKKANEERKELGLPPIWPSDAPPYTNHVTRKVECFDFDNSIEYFAYILDADNYGTDNWKPTVSGIDFHQFAGAGVHKCDNGNLLPKNNMWMIAKNITDETDDLIPLLVTRNLDAGALLSSMDSEEENSDKYVLGEDWDKPFSDKGAVLVRLGGGMFTVRSRYAMPRVIYNGQTFDANANSKYPLKYLTPDKEVVPRGKL